MMMMMMMINDYHYHNDHDDFYSCGWLQNAMQCLEMRNIFVNDCQCFEMYEKSATIGFLAFQNV